MSKSLKIILIAVGGFVGLLVLIAVALVFFVDANAYKPRLESTASKALGMEVKVDGQVGIGFFPSLRVTLDDVHIRNRGTDVASAKVAKLGIDLLPLLHKEVRLRSITLKSPQISIERNLAGTFNFEKTEEASAVSHALELAKVSLSDGTFRYVDKQSGNKFEASNCRLDVRTRQLSSGQSTELIKNVSFTAELACGEARRNEVAVSDLKLSADGKNGVIVLKPVTMRLFGAKGSGNIQADVSGAVPHYHVHYTLPQFPIEEFFKTVSSQQGPEGLMDFSANLSMQGTTLKEMRQTVNGQFSLRGENLIVNGSDLDEMFARFESSQHFNLVDVGAFFFAGPVGVVVTKGFNFASILQGGGQTKIRTLVSEWKIEHGVAQAQDVAMATDKNRVALHGGLNFVSEQFDDVTVALIDNKGCAKAKQKIHGSFQKPVVDKPNIFKSLSGPFREILKKGGKLFNGGECDVFYAGSVAPPK